MIYNIPNILTVSRLGMAAVFFVLLAFKSWWTIPVLGLAGITDLLDGYLARRYQQMTDFGRIADPCIDKILICSGFIFLVKATPDICKPWMVAIIVSREFIVTALRSLAESRGRKFAATFWGKSKMSVQFTTMTFLILLFLWHAKASDIPDVMQTIGLVMMWVTTGVTFLSGMVYLVQAHRLTRGPEDA
jgi:CDP-diacylglycerol--glycerol-3-phosphate 3-phosphatidyltransferase